jgi:hypothetical protein
VICLATSSALHPLSWLLCPSVLSGPKLPLLNRAIILSGSQFLALGPSCLFLLLSLRGLPAFDPPLLLFCKLFGDRLSLRHTLPTSSVIRPYSQLTIPHAILSPDQYMILLPHSIYFCSSRPLSERIPVFVALIIIIGRSTYGQCFYGLCHRHRTHRVCRDAIRCSEGRRPELLIMLSYSLFDALCYNASTHPTNCFCQYLVCLSIPFRRITYFNPPDP